MEDPSPVGASDQATDSALTFDCNLGDHEAEDQRGHTPIFDPQKLWDFFKK